MSNTQELLSALQTATEEFAGHALSQDEKNDLIRLFNQGSGASIERAINTISRFTQLSQEEMTNKTAESQSTDQAMMILEDKIRNWRPGA